MTVTGAHRRSDPLLVLIPSPLLGPYSWLLVADELRAAGWETLVADQLRDPARRRPCWRRTVDGVAAALEGAAVEGGAVLIAHSGAGPLLPAVAGAVGPPIAAYFFVDAGLPAPGRSRVAQIEQESPDLARELRMALARGHRFPNWTDHELRELVPDADRRARLLAELRPQGADYWTEPLPSVSGWPNAPCAYLHFSPPYRPAADRARGCGWPIRHLPAGHFHQLVDPPAVAEAIVDLLAVVGLRIPPLSSLLNGGEAA